MDFLLGRYFEEILNNVPQVDMKRRDNDENVEGSISCETVESMEGQEEVDTKTLKTLTKQKMSQLIARSMRTADMDPPLEGCLAAKPLLGAALRVSQLLEGF